FHSAGVVRRELEKRVTLAAQRNDHAVALELLDDDGHLVARHLRIMQTLVNVADAEQTIAALTKELDDEFLDLCVAHLVRLGGAPAASPAEYRDDCAGEAAGAP